MNIGERLKHYREAKGFTIYRLHGETDVSQNHISAIETGKRQPTIELLSRLLAPMGITLAEFFNEGEASYLTDNERLLVENYRTLPNEKSAALLELSRLLQ